MNRSVVYGVHVHLGVKVSRQGLVLDLFDVHGFVVRELNAGFIGLSYTNTEVLVAVLGVFVSYVVVLLVVVFK